MGGGTLQLALVGSQDILLSGAPQVTFFRQVYKRATMFSQEALQQTFAGTADFGRKCTCPISRTGDLVSHVWMQITLPALTDFRYAAAQTATATVPAIQTARWTGSTTASVVITAPTATLAAQSGYAVRYAATVTAAGGASTVFYSDGLTIPITGLSAGTQYSVTVRREQTTVGGAHYSGSPYAQSASMDIESVRWCNSVGHAIIKAVELEIGGMRIDRHVSEYLDILSELTMPEEKKAGFETMIGKYPDWDVYDNSFQEARTLYVPLQFTFNKNPGLSIPLVSLQFHDVKLNFEFREYTELIRATTSVTSLTHLSTGAMPSMDCQLYATFTYLDLEERRRFSQAPAEILIEQCQFLGDTPIIIDAVNPNVNRKISINFSHPVKELIWVYNYADTFNSNIPASQYSTGGNDYFNCSLPAPYQDEDPVADALVQLNGHNRFPSRPGSYFRLVQPYQHHTRIPSKNIYTYSFALNAEDTNPSGTCNFSRCDTAHLIVNLNPRMVTAATKGRIRVFANSFNVMRVASGLAGLVFAGG